MTCVYREGLLIRCSACSHSFDLVNGAWPTVNEGKLVTASEIWYVLIRVRESCSPVHVYVCGGEVVNSPQCSHTHSDSHLYPLPPSLSLPLSLPPSREGPLGQANW